MFTGDKLWVKGFSSSKPLKFIVYYHIGGLLECTKKTTILIVKEIPKTTTTTKTRSTDDDSSITNSVNIACKSISCSALWISDVVTYRVDKALLTEINIVGEIYSLQMVSSQKTNTITPSIPTTTKVSKTISVGHANDDSDDDDNDYSSDGGDDDDDECDDAVDEPLTTTKHIILGDALEKGYCPSENDFEKLINVMDFETITLESDDSASNNINNRTRKDLKPLEYYVCDTNGCESLLVTIPKKEILKKNNRKKPTLSYSSSSALSFSVKKKQKECEHKKYFVSDIWITEKEGLPFKTVVRYIIFRRSKHPDEVCLLCSFTKYLTSHYTDKTISISQPLCSILTNC